MPANLVPTAVARQRGVPHAAGAVQRGTFEADKVACAGDPCRGLLPFGPRSVIARDGIQKVL